MPVTCEQRTTDRCEHAYLDQILAFWLGDQRLQLGRGECVDEASLGDDEEEDLGSSQDGKLVCLDQRQSDELPTARCVEAPTFFMIPAFLLEKVMCRRDLSWMNLISIFRRSRPGLSSSSSSSSAAALGRGRLMPRGSLPSPAPLLAPASSRVDGDAWSCSVISPIVSRNARWIHG
jgi:hypothetical protein